MTETQRTSTGRTTLTAAGSEPTGWVGWVVFAGIMLIMIGSFQAIAGLVGLFNDEYYLVSSNKTLIHMDYTAWGWAHLIIGAILIGAGFGALAGQMWARVIGIGVAFLSALANLAFLAAYPIWSVMMITIDVLVIFALSVHGREVKAVV